MRYNMKKGISLIVLVITIIVMIILATAIILALDGNNITKKAIEARNANDLTTMKEAYQMALIDGEYHSTFDNYVLEKNYNLKIGDIVNYDEGTGYTTDALQDFEISDDQKNFEMDATSLGWRVLGVDDEGRVELVSASSTADTFTLNGDYAYVHGVEAINQICTDLYSHGKGAYSSRSLKAKDVLKIIEDYYKLEIDYGEDYGSLWEYRYFSPASGDAAVQYRVSKDQGKTYSDWEYMIDSEGNKVQEYVDPNGKILNASNKEEIIKVKYTSFSFFTKNYLYKSFDMLDVLFRGVDSAKRSSSGYTKNTWLADYADAAAKKKAYYGIFFLGNDSSIKRWTVRYSNSLASTNSLAVRPVVTLNKDTEFVFDSSTNSYNIK